MSPTFSAMVVYQGASTQQLPNSASKRPSTRPRYPPGMHSWKAWPSMVHGRWAMDGGMLGGYCCWFGEMMSKEKGGNMRFFWFRLEKINNQIFLDVEV